MLKQQLLSFANFALMKNTKSIFGWMLDNAFVCGEHLQREKESITEELKNFVLYQNLDGTTLMMLNCP